MSINKMERFAEAVNFELEETLCYGVEEKWNKYSIPVQVDDHTKDSLSALSKQYSAKNPVRGERTVYLKIEGLTMKQRIELLGRGKCYIHVKFQCTGIYTSAKDSMRYLVLRPTKLARCNRQVELEIAED